MSKFNKNRTYPQKPGFDSKALLLTNKNLRETGFAEFAWVSPDYIMLGLKLIRNGTAMVKILAIAQW